MLIAGLTGSIGMGKSTAAARFRARGVPVFDADAAVHALYEAQAVGPVGEAFPGAVSGGRIDRKTLAGLLAGEPERYAQLEAIVHPLVREAERAFVRDAAASAAWLAVLEIPLLFETGAEARVDVTIVVSAPQTLQRARVLARPGMSEETFGAVRARQMPDAEKRARATYVVDTSGTTADCAMRIDTLIDALRAHAPGTAYALVYAGSGDK